MDVYFSKTKSKETKFQGLNTEKGVFKVKADLFNTQKAFLMSMKRRTAETHGDGMCQQATVLMTLVLSVIRRQCLFTHIYVNQTFSTFLRTIPHKSILEYFHALVLGLSRVSSNSISLSSSYHSNKFHLSMNPLK